MSQVARQSDAVGAFVSTHDARYKLVAPPMALVDGAHTMKLSPPLDQAVSDPAPQLGADSAAVLAELGYSANEVTRLQLAGAFGGSGAVAVARSKL